jgi:hypothetical protein
MTVTEIKPHRWSWKVFEASGVEPVFPKKDQAIRLRAEPRLLPVRSDSRFGFERHRRTQRLCSALRIESCDARF